MRKPVGPARAWPRAIARLKAFAHIEPERELRRVPIDGGINIDEEKLAPFSREGGSLTRHQMQGQDTSMRVRVFVREAVRSLDPRWWSPRICQGA